MSAIDIVEKYPDKDKLEKRHNKKKLEPLKYKEKRRFGKLRRAIKNIKKQNSKK
jgi:hypothetical protein